MSEEAVRGSSTSTEEETRAGNVLIEGVFGFILCVTVVAWAVVGFVVWIPLLVRTTTSFAGAVLYGSLFPDDKRVERAAGSVHFAVRFFSRGFKHFVDFHKHRHDPQRETRGILKPISGQRWKELLVECAWVAGVWGVGYIGGRLLFGGLGS